ncbi:MAG: hypothetical protein N2235_18520 [Fischerella sp.]|nr:hypothetical protein [Fischerella sp.]
MTTTPAHAHTNKRLRLLLENLAGTINYETLIGLDDVSDNAIAA